jgi:hypothetical protein
LAASYHPGVTRYRDEVAALRSRQLALEERIAEQERTLSEKDDKVAELERRVADFEADAGDAEPAVLPRRAPEATRLTAQPMRPRQVGCAVAAVVGLALAMIAVFLMAIGAEDPAPLLFCATVMGLLLGLVVWQLWRQLGQERYIDYSSRGLGLRGFQHHERLLEWRDVGDVRVTETKESGAQIEVQSLQSEQWHDVGVGFPGERARRLIEQWKRHQRAARLGRGGD